MPVLKVNGRTQDLRVPDDTPLLYALRNDLQINSPKYGCGAAQCGSCTVLVDGQSVRSCVTPVGSVSGQNIITLEGLGSSDKMHKLQKAFIDEQAMQCGYCVNGVILRAKELLDKTPKPTEREVRLALDGHLCRCGAQNRMVRAVLRAASEG
jgi:nicotinate dehydrogenase subunit A